MNQEQYKEKSIYKNQSNIDEKKDYCYIGFIKNYRFNAPEVYKTDSIPQNTENGCFSTAYYYPQEIIAYYGKCKTLKGYDGRVFAPHFLLKTSKDITFNEAVETVQSFLIYMENKYRINRRHLRYLFDGEKSIIIRFPAELFNGFSADKNLPLFHKLLKMKLISEDMQDKFDNMLYSAQSMLPFTNTRNSRTRYYTVELSAEEILLQSKEILQLAGRKRKGNESAPPAELKTNPLLEEVKEEVLNTIGILKLLYGDSGPNGYINLRLIDRQGNSKNIFMQNYENTVKSAFKNDGKTHIYYGIATRKDASSGYKGNLEEVNALWADIDYGKQGHKNETGYDTKEDVLSVLDGLKHKPSAVIHSGHGFQALWKLNKPVIINGENIKKLEEINKGLQRLIGGDTVQNLDRVFRFPYTLNIKDDIPIKSSVFNISNALSYSIEELEEWVNAGPAAETKSAAQKKDYPFQDEIKSDTQTAEIKLPLLPVKGLDAIKKNCRWIRDLYDKSGRGENIAHNDRVAAAVLLLQFRGGKEEIQKIMSNIPGYDPEKTIKQIQQISAGDYKPYLCDTLCGSRCSCIKKIDRKSPIAFAYRTERKKVGIKNSFWHDDVKPLSLEKVSNTENFISALEKLVIALADKGLPLIDIKSICSAWRDFQDGEFCTEEVLEQAVDTFYTIRIFNDGPFWKARERDGKINTEVDIQELIAFLESEGYAKYYIQQECFFIKISDNRVHEVSLTQIKDFVFSYIKELGISEAVIKELKNELISRAGTYFGEKQLECIESKKITFRRDKKDEAYFYFRNCFATVNKNGVILSDYSRLDGLIWEEQIKDRNFRLLSDSGRSSQFRRFIWNVSAENEDRFHTLCSAIGYMLHNYKDSSNAKAIIFCDEKISDNPCGRTGKSLVSKALSKLRESVRIDGKNFEFGGQFSFQQINMRSEILEFNDVRAKFGFERLFSVITDAMTVERKREHAYSIPFEESPKILISTNYTIKGSSESFKARKFEVEFSDHYNAACTPEHEFGNLFFEGWNEEEWEKFDNFMLWCVRLYLEKGLIETSSGTLLKKQLIYETNKVFAYFMETHCVLDKEYNKKDFFKLFLRQYPECNFYKQNTFSKWLESYENIMGLELHQRSSDGKQLIRFTKGRKESKK